MVDMAPPPPCPVFSSSKLCPKIIDIDKAEKKREGGKKKGEKRGGGRRGGGRKERYHMSKKSSGASPPNPPTSRGVPAPHPPLALRAKWESRLGPLFEGKKSRLEKALTSVKHPYFTVSTSSYQTTGG